MKTLMLLTLSLLTLNVLASEMVPEAICRGSIPSDEHGEVSEFKFYVGVDTYCGTARSSNQSIMLVDDGPHPSVNQASMVRIAGPEGDKVTHSLNVPGTNTSVKFEYTIKTIPSNGVGSIEIENQKVEFKCSFPGYHFDC